MKYKRVKQQILLLLAIVLALTAAVGAVMIWLRHKDSAEPTIQQAEPTAETLIQEGKTYWVNNVELAEAGGITITHAHIPWDAPRRPGEIREIRYITIHETDNRSSGADSAAHSSLLTENGSDITGWHYTVDDHSIYHNIPDNEISWNAGDNRTSPGGNMNGIGIEMCVNLTNDYEQTLRNTASLVGVLLVTYDLNPDDVRLHADFMDKECPHRLISEGRTAQFYDMIAQAYSAQAVRTLQGRIEELLQITEE